MVKEGGSSFKTDGETGAWQEFLDGILNPEKPVIMVLTDHQGCAQ
jgi:hypothetical protein